MIQNKYIVGMTGGSGSGKSTLLEIAAGMGMLAINCDKVVHAAMLRPNQCYYQVVQTFGQGILDDAGEINRRALGAIVFNDARKLELLNEVVHKYVDEYIENAAETTQHAIIAVDAPVLHKARVFDACDRIITVAANQQTRLQRIMARDGISEDAAVRRIQNQPSDAQYAAFADYVLHNDGDEAQFARAAKTLLEKILRELTRHTLSRQTHE